MAASCQVQGAAYRCPRCSVEYCSLACYKAEVRLLEDAALGDGLGVGDGDLEDVEEGEEGEEGEEEALAARLAGLDLETASASEILARLSPEEQRRFEELLRAPDDAMRLLPEWVPWWSSSLSIKAARRSIAARLDSEDDDDEDDDEDDGDASEERDKRLAVDPACAYAYACRTLRGEIHSNPSEAAALVFAASHVLDATTTPTFVYTTPRDAVSVAASRLGAHCGAAVKAIIAVLHDTRDLVRAHRVAVLALSDLHRLLNAAGKRGRAAARRVWFVLCLVCDRDAVGDAGVTLWPLIAASIDDRLEQLGRDAETAGAASSVRQAQGSVAVDLAAAAFATPKPTPQRPLIQEL
nr:Zinc finger HIT domain-containing protein 2 [Polyrhizophydium stewartii]